MSILQTIILILAVFVIPQAVGITIFMLLLKNKFLIRISTVLIPSATYLIISYGFCCIQGGMFKESGFVLCSGFCRQTVYTTLWGVVAHLVVAIVLILLIEKFLSYHKQGTY